MKKIVKSLAVLLIFAFIFSSFTVFASAAINVDGNVSTKEWSEAQTFNLINSKSESLNNIDLARAKVLKTDEYTIYLAVTATDSTDKNIDDCSVLLNISDAGTYNFGADNSSDFSENDIVDIDYKTTGDTADSIFFEFKLTFKTKVSDNIQLKVNFRDAEGVLSKESIISGIKSLNNEDVTSEQIKTTKPVIEKTTKYKNTTKVSVEKETNSETESVTAEQITISTVGSENRAKDKTIKTIMTIFAALLIIAAAAIIIFARFDKKKEDTKEK
ncbi:MAG: hypothetical protein IJM97_05895 [Clostridia bacterium]|nr:hypothetical protein [Clostridia bacterium]